MLRTADAAGVTAMIATDPGTDWANPNVVRARKGAVYAVAVVSADTAEVLAWLAERDIPVLAATPDATTVYTALHQLLNISLIDSMPCRTGYSRARVHRPGIGNRSTSVSWPSGAEVGKKSDRVKAVLTNGDTRYGAR